MKTQIKTPILFFLIFLGIFTLTASCKKDPCESIVCLNGGTCANGLCNCPTGYTGSDCGTAMTPTSVRVNSMKLTRYPMTTLSGGGWDALAGNGPDVFLSINSGTSANTNSFVSGRYDNVTGQTLSFTSNLPVTISSPSSYYVVGVWDEDTTGNEFMSGVYFIPNDFRNGFPSTITLNTSLMTVELNVTWLF